MKNNLIKHVKAVKVALVSIFFVAMAFNIAMVASSPASGESGLTLGRLRALAVSIGEGGYGQEGDPCINNSWCSHDLLCIEGTCQHLTCLETGYNCPNGTYCAGYYCVDNYCNHGAQECTNNHICVNNTCVGGGHCTDNSDCAYGQYCDAGTCVGSGGVNGWGCTSDSECGFNEFCFNNTRCLALGPPCYNDNQCQGIDRPACDPNINQCVPHH